MSQQEEQRATAAPRPGLLVWTGRQSCWEEIEREDPHLQNVLNRDGQERGVSAASRGELLPAAPRVQLSYDNC